LKIMSNRPNEDLGNISGLEAQEGQGADGVEGTGAGISGVRDGMREKIGAIFAIFLNPLKRLIRKGVVKAQVVEIDESEKLIRNLGSLDQFMQQIAVREIKKRGKVAALSIWIRALSDENVRVRRLAVKELRKDLSVVGPLIQALGDKDERVRGVATASLIDLEAVALTALIEVLRVGDKNMRVKIINILGCFYEKAPEVVPVLVRALDDPDSEIRIRAAIALGNLGEKAPEVIPVLVRALDDPDSEIRIRAAIALGCFYEKAPEVVPVLTRAFDVVNAEARSDVVGALGNVGVNTPEVVSVLIRALDDPYRSTRKCSASALEKIGVIDAATAIKILEIRREEARQLASDKLQELGVKAVVGLIEAATCVSDIDLRTRAQLVLQRIMDGLGFEFVVSESSVAGCWNQDFLKSCFSLNSKESPDGEGFVDKLVRVINQILYEGDKSENPLMNMKSASAILTYWPSFVEFAKEAEVNSGIVTLKNLLESSQSFQEVIRNIEDRIKFLEGFAVAADEALFQ
jgi:HEAT repeat protein